MIPSRRHGPLFYREIESLAPVKVSLGQSRSKEELKHPVQENERDWIKSEREEQEPRQGPGEKRVAHCIGFLSGRGPNYKPSVSSVLESGFWLKVLEKSVRFFVRICKEQRRLWRWDPSELKTSDSKATSDHKHIKFLEKLQRSFVSHRPWDERCCIFIILFYSSNLKEQGHFSWPWT